MAPVIGQIVTLRADADFDAEFRYGVELGSTGVVEELGGWLFLDDSVWVAFMVNGEKVVLECDPEWIAA